MLRPMDMEWAHMGLMVTKYFWLYNVNSLTSQSMMLVMAVVCIFLKSPGISSTIYTALCGKSFLCVADSAHGNSG